VERAENLVNTTKSSIPNFHRQANNARLQLSILTGHLPNSIAPILSEWSKIPKGSIEPVLMAPTQVLQLRPDIRAASANLAANTTLTQSTFAELFPSFSLGGFFGVADSALASTTSFWPY